MHDDPLNDLPSPFLQEELFAAEPAPDWEAGASVFEAESPFLSAFGGAEQGEPLGVASAHADAMEMEEGALEWVLEEEYEDGKVAGNQIADAFVADDDAKAYFDTFPQLGDLTVKQVTVLKPSNFEKLIDLMLASGQKNFVIDAHGSPEGLALPLAGETALSASKKALFILQAVERIRFMVRIAQDSVTIWERASGVEDVERWRRIVEVMHSKTWQQLIGPEWPVVIPQVADVASARKIIESRIASLATALFPGAVADKQMRMDRLVGKMLKLQAKGIREIQFRACNIGKDPVTLYQFRKFFGADHLCAPDVRSGAGYVTPYTDRRSVDLLARRRLTQVYELPSGRFAIFIEIKGHTWTGNCAADSQAAVGEWVAAHLMPNARYRKGRLPIHFLQTDRRAFPLDKEYAAHIQCRSSLWEGVVRAGEVEEEVPRDQAGEPESDVSEDEAIDGQHEAESDYDPQEWQHESANGLQSEDEPQSEDLWDNAPVLEADPREQGTASREQAPEPGELFEEWTGAPASDESSDGLYGSRASMGEAWTPESAWYELDEDEAPGLELDVFEHDTPGRGMAAPSPFPTRFARLSASVSRRDKLGRAFAAAIAAVAGTSPSVRDLPIAIVALDADDSNSRPVAGQKMTEMHYSGSLLKVAAMVAAYQLRVAVNDLAATLDATRLDTEQKLFTAIAASFDPQIVNAVSRINKKGIERRWRVPKYRDIFVPSRTGGHYTLDFRAGAAAFFGQMNNMIVESDNNSAGFCIRTLGYSWINGVLQAAGFYDEAAAKAEGIWLAGDYGSAPTVEIASVNDRMVKQATTCYNMAWLITLLHDGKLVKDVIGNAEMLSLLKFAVNSRPPDAPHARSLLKRPFEPPPLGSAAPGTEPPFKILHTKIGVGNLKRDPKPPHRTGSCIPGQIHGCVFSEASILEHTSGRKFVAVWQNLVDAKKSDLASIVDVIQKTMDGYHP